MLQRVIDWVVGLAVCLMLLTGVVLWGGAMHHERLLSVQTASMVPTFRPGDAVVVRTIHDSSQLHIGEVVSYRSLRDPRVIISHRIVAINHQTNILTTAGDALHSPDPAISVAAVTEQVIAVVPQFGHILDFVQRPTDLIIVLYVPAGCLMTYEIYRATRGLRRPAYRYHLYRW